MNLAEQIDENTILNYIENNGVYDNAETDEVITNYLLSFKFYGEIFMVGISSKDILEDNNYGLTIEGASQLFDSFEEACHNKLWPLIKQKCNDLAAWEGDQDDDLPF
jgi:hypothetical protein